MASKKFSEEYDLNESPQDKFNRELLKGWGRSLVEAIVSMSFLMLVCYIAIKVLVYFGK